LLLTTEETEKSGLGFGAVRCKVVSRFSVLSLHTAKQGEYSVQFGRISVQIFVGRTERREDFQIWLHQNVLD
jgi:hypothetical protein